MNTSKLIVASYCRRRRGKKSQKRGQKTRDPETTTAIDLRARVQVDCKPDWMKDMRVVRGLTDDDQSRIFDERNVYSGYKIVSATMQGMGGFKYKQNYRYTHAGSCSSGFHFSADPLQCLRYAFCHNMVKPWRLFKVESSTDIIADSDKLCCRDIVLKSEIKDEDQKSQMMKDGICITWDSIHCYKDGKLHDPGWNAELNTYISAVYEKYFGSNRARTSSYKNGELINVDDFNTTWPPIGFETIKVN
jgi:hypothetical protein